jgi:hypothetical protein
MLPSSDNSVPFASRPVHPPSKPPCVGPEAHAQMFVSARRDGASTSEPRPPDSATVSWLQIASIVRWARSGDRPCQFVSRIFAATPVPQTISCRGTKSPDRLDNGQQSPLSSHRFPGLPRRGIAAMKSGMAIIATPLVLRISELV